MSQEEREKVKLRKSQGTSKTVNGKRPPMKYFSDKNKNFEVDERVRQASPQRKRARATVDSDEDELASDDDGSKSKKKHKGRRPKTKAEEAQFDQDRREHLEDLLVEEPKKPHNWEAYSATRKEKWREERARIRERNEAVEKDHKKKEKARNSARETRRKARRYDQGRSNDKDASSDDSDIEVVTESKGKKKKKVQEVVISESEDGDGEEERWKAEPTGKIRTTTVTALRSTGLAMCALLWYVRMICLLPSL